MADKTEKRGGKREGAGRRPKGPPQFSDALKKEFLMEMKRIAKETGLTFARIVLETAYGLRGDHPTAAQSAQNLIASILVVKETKQEVNVKNQVMPQIYLPEPMEVPSEARAKLNEAIARVH